MKRIRIAAALALTFAVAVPAQAQNASGPVATNAYITQGGLNWAWAYPLPSSSFGFIISAFQASQGWRLPTAAEIAAAPNATDFLFPGGNVPFNGTDPGSGATFAATNGTYTGDGACATPWFSTVYNHCDWQDGQGQPYGPWAGDPNAYSLAEQLVVRTAVVATPEPASMALLATGLVGIGFVARRRRQA